MIFCILVVQYGDVILHHDLVELLVKNLLSFI